MSALTETLVAVASSIYILVNLKRVLFVKGSSVTEKNCETL